MLGKMARAAWLCAAVGAAGLPGLCASAPANTSVIPVQAAPQGAEDMGAPGVELFSVAPSVASPSAPAAAPPSSYPPAAYSAPTSSAPAYPAQGYPAPVTPTAYPAAVSPPPAYPRTYPAASRSPSYRSQPGPAYLPVRIALLLPLRSATLGQAAEAVRSGFMAAYEHEASPATVDVVATGDTPQEILDTYTEAARAHDIIVGPLSRSGVSALAASSAVDRPTIALAHPDSAGDAPVRLPANLLVIGLSVEEEARQLARWAYDANSDADSDSDSDRALILTTNAAWQRRAAKAFAAQWQSMGGEARTMEMSTAASGYLSASALSQLKKRIQAEAPSVILAALGAEQARQVRLAAGPDLPLYGTSQLNALALPDWAIAEPMREMNGVRLLDLPWQLQVSHPAVMVYPRAPADPEKRRDPDLERLYALGIDAYRVAVGISRQSGRFELDGVTGRLSVTFGNGFSHFERQEQQALYVDGAVAPWNGR